MSRLTKVYTADNVLEVGLMRSLLEQHGIASELRNHHTSSLLGEVPYTSTWPELWTDIDSSLQARELISDAQKRDVTGEDWVCSNCEAAVPSNFDICWQCGSPEN